MGLRYPPIGQRYLANAAAIGEPAAVAFAESSPVRRPSSCNLEMMRPAATTPFLATGSTCWRTAVTRASKSTARQGGPPWEATTWSTAAARASSAISRVERYGGSESAPSASLVRLSSWRSRLSTSARREGRLSRSNRRAPPAIAARWLAPSEKTRTVTASPSSTRAG